MQVRRAATIALGILVVAIGFFVVVPAWKYVEFWEWCSRNRIPCALFPLTYDLLGTTFSTENYSTAQALLISGLAAVVLGLAMITLTINKIHQAMSR
jgi:sulfite exporter TauE/SafE